MLSVRLTQIIVRSERWRDESDTFLKYTVWQTVIRGRQIRKRHAESSPGDGTQRLNDDDDDLEETC